MIAGALRRMPQILPRCMPWVVLLLAACAVQDSSFPAGQVCETTEYSVRDDFVAARRGHCEVLSESSVRLSIVPEDDKVSNPSPWYAFRLDPRRPSNATIIVDYGTWKHRYPPKISDDGETWRAMQPGAVSVAADGRVVTLELELGDSSLWIAAQEIVSPEQHDEWQQELVAASGATVVELGRSIADQPILAIDSNTGKDEVLFIVGRQHPPEVSGAYALAGFVEMLFGESELANRFRNRFRIIVIPLLNPDGVRSGHWRQNLGGVDLNRDWGPFTQPETRLVRNLLDRIDADGLQVRWFLDFHSTSGNLFYTQLDGDVTTPPGITREWLARSKQRLPDYPFTDEPREITEKPTGRNYMFKRYGIPSMTYEVGDETTRQAATSAARVFAEELMQILLETS